MEHSEQNALFEAAKRVVEQHDKGLLSNVSGDSTSIEKLREALKLAEPESQHHRLDVIANTSIEAMCWVVTCKYTRTSEVIHNAAKSLLTNIPPCIDSLDGKTVVAYRVGVMELAKLLTGESAIQSDKRHE